MAKKPIKKVAKKAAPSKKVAKKAAKPAKKAATKKMPISAKTGKIVTAKYAKKHPKTTVNLTSTYNVLI